MKKPTVITFLLLNILILLLLSGCSSQRILLANFDNDATGNLPDLTLTGDPIGDEITWSGSTANSSASLAPLKVIADINGEAGDNILRLFHATSVQAIGPHLGFHARPTAEPDGIYNVFWGGVIEHPGDRSSQALSIAVYSTAYIHYVYSLVGLRIYRTPDGPGEGWTSVNVRDQNGPERHIGYIREDLPHSGLVVINLNTQKYSLLFGGLSATGDLPSDTTIDRLSLYLSFAPTDPLDYSLGLGTYYIDDVKMLQNEPDED
ncbi:hypothetical protein FX988_03122 [Paraglaciecola mesophila]|uniref:Lipoprotein n=1 Tax=Paraglaciecola mesophila TaxID=197222 RepID=A0A857JQN9_9ALTE|nr:hypothetical protein [Paraglaciecola mesophila]QHJ12864.1 hypothetical protein FX988_03122 [Paraglaciecola mesophila]